MNEAKRERQRKKFEAQVKEQMRLRATFRAKPIYVAVRGAIQQLARS